MLCAPDQPCSDPPADRAPLQASLAGLSVYQDVVLGGQVVRSGVRNCEERWALLDERLPRSGVVLDIGSNFGWFGLAVANSRPDCVVVSVEADERSATVQREVLASHRQRRIVLLTEAARAAVARRFASAGQRFAAVLCLSVLHWIRGHRELLRELGQISDAIFIEHPHPDEVGAGDATILREIGEIGPYLRQLFPDRPVTCLGQTVSHRRTTLPRELWVVGDPTASAGRAERTELALEPLVQSGLAWPNRCWWEGELDALSASPASSPRNEPNVVLTPAGLACGAGAHAPGHARRLVSQIPDSGLARPWTLWRRRVRRAAVGMVRALWPA